MSRINKELQKKLIRNTWSTNRIVEIKNLIARLKTEYILSIQ